MKRRTNTLRSPQEQKADLHRDYGYMVKEPSKINEIWKQKPYESVQKVGGNTWRMKDFAQ